MVTNRFFFFFELSLHRNFQSAIAETASNVTETLSKNNKKSESDSKFQCYTCANKKHK